MGARYPIKIESRKSRKSHARYFGRISQSREIQKVRDFRNPSLNGDIKKFYLNRLFSWRDT